MQLRKVIHISGVLIPVITGFTGKIEMIYLVLLVMFLFLIVEILKPRISTGILSMFYRENELSGFSFEPLSYFLSILSLLYISFFIDESICFAAIAILAAGDGFAGVMGRKFGKHRFSFNRNKSWEGSISGFVAASMTGFYYAGQIAIIGSFAGMLAGAVNKNDNIAVPYAAFIAMVFVNYAQSLY